MKLFLFVMMVFFSCSFILSMNSTENRRMQFDYDKYISVRNKLNELILYSRASHDYNAIIAVNVFKSESVCDFESNKKSPSVMDFLIKKGLADIDGNIDKESLRVWKLFQVFAK